jgi:quercetin dioxygenase-like cupin family protein
MEYITTSDKLVHKRPVDGLIGTIAHGAGMTLASWSFTSGTTLPEHAHPHEQIALVIEGELELTIDGTAHILKPGDTAVIPGNVPHAARALSACRVVDAFQPAREDLR